MELRHVKAPIFVDPLSFASLRSGNPDEEAGMAQLEQMVAELEKALDRLETECASLLGMREQARETARENAALKSERDTLAARVAELESHVRSLTEATDEVESRLDGAIAEIRTALAR